MANTTELARLIDVIKTDPTLEDVKYGNKDVICKVFSMKKPTLDKWIKDIKDNFPIENTVINPTEKTCFINIAKFEDYLIWKSEKKYK